MPTVEAAAASAVAVLTAPAPVVAVPDVAAATGCNCPGAGFLLKLKLGRDLREITCAVRSASSAAERTATTCTAHDTAERRYKYQSLCCGSEGRYTCADTERFTVAPSAGLLESGKYNSCSSQANKTNSVGILH